ncbi:DUF1338 domain-containing protein [Endozoicomonas sp. OPT23]|uniref:DUF1338 domain-containing protein n=1 Tax=Endozoicomonas sp. OPT23 TaxID=2072845 RepID=UPI00129AE761|nr:DUF1338 domain-containing protein [Endozoicomonas sp. OPT23]MRI33485.1 DUF1338 domain-containing protein [Endozoicomonas sp. OPT23]
MTNNKINVLLEAMWQNYLELTPDARSIHDLFAEQNNGLVINDHIALRTFNLNKVNIDTVARPFLEAGYIEAGHYEFPNRKLVARHYQHKDDTLPKVFISELLVEKLSTQAQTIINKLVDQVSDEQVAKDEFCFSGRNWQVSKAEYETLLAESEYAAWVSAFGYRPNHFTVSINHLTSHQDIQDLNQTLINSGYTLNTNGGEVKGSPEVLLEQSSTMAGKVKVTFDDGQSLDIPSCFYEFAKRYPMADGQLYHGFVAASADKIFESTDQR